MAFIIFSILFRALHFFRVAVQSETTISGSAAVDEGSSTRNRWPSALTSNGANHGFGFGFRSANKVCDEPTSRSSPLILISTERSTPSNPRKEISLLSPRHTGKVPPSVEICQRPFPEGKLVTYTSSRPES